MTVLRLLILLTIFSSCAAQQARINGLSFVAARETIDETHTAPVVEIGANYTAIMPFGFIKNLAHPEIVHNTERQWFGETRAGAKQYINELRKQQIKIMIKPQIWVWRGEFTGNIKMTNETDWKTLEDSYSSFILEYAELAQETKAEILCIGTELENFVKERPEYWSNLIKKIKTIYKGKLTYAANWDEFKRTPFWSELDYIGVDAYFPVSDQQTPTVEDCKAGWQKHKSVIKALSETHNRPILFTEYGYRSMDYTGKEPWVSDHSLKSLNFEGQSNATQALFEEFWNEEWFAGGFIWKWFHAYDRVGGENDNQFTPQNKPVEEVIALFYKTN
ncbi:glycoside hydrolase [uncultured Psychroserpens sp.]|uniref:glycoside hydrolase family 113 n=1 Tax=uncultured Psychroserpens sp. TaxID=255436 RepID=UPI002620586E|nr:glycoside hydrolase [uncultured Psychroserpens sp.]